MTDLIPDSDQYCQDFHEVKPVNMNLISSDGQILCAKYNDYGKYVDAIRPTLEDNTYRCKQSGMVLCPGN